MKSFYPLSFFCHSSYSYRYVILGKAISAFLLHILQCFQIFFTCTDFYNLLYIVNKNLTISDMTCIKSFRCCLNDFFNRNVSDNDFHFYFWKYGNIHLNSTIFFSRTFLDSTSHNLRYCHSCYTQIIESGFQPFIFGGVPQGYDLIWRGVEITTGAQREHRYDVLKKQAEEKGLADDVKFYLEFFQYGCPPHGGFGLGIDRLTMLLCGQSIKDAEFLFRGPNRLTP